MELGLAEKHEIDADSDGPDGSSGPLPSKDSEGGGEDEGPAGCVMYKAIPFEVALESAYQAQRESIEGA